MRFGDAGHILVTPAEVEQILRTDLDHLSVPFCYMDLPDTALVQKYQAAMDKASSPETPGCNRQVTAFFFRDWWSLHSRYEFDLRQLLRGLQQQQLPAAEDMPRSSLKRA